MSSARLNYGKTFLLGFGFFGVSVIWGVYNAFVPIFLADKFELSPVLIGFFMTLDNIAALFIQPPVGAWSDKLRSPMGRRIPFILVGAPITAVAFGLIPIAAILPLFVACTSTLLLSAALWRTPVVALMPDITPSEFRSQANGIINFMGGIGTIVALQTGGILYKISPNFPFWLGSGLVLVAALIVYLFIEEPKEYENAEEQPGMFESLKEVFNNPDKSGLRILLAIFFWFIGFSAVETFFTLYAKNHLGLNEGDGATLLSVLPLFFVLSAIPSGFVAGKLGRRTTIATGLIIITIMLVLLYITPAEALLTGIAPLPLVGIPLHPEQELNVDLAVRRGMAMASAPRHAGTPRMAAAVQRIVADARFKEAALRVQRCYAGIDGAANAAAAIVRHLHADRVGGATSVRLS